jgi:magnesium transporter
VRLDEIQERIEQGKWAEAREALARWPFPKVADLLLEQQPQNRALLFRALDWDQAADVFSYLDAENQNEFLRDLTDEETQRVLADLSPDDRTQLLGELPGEATQKLLNFLPPEECDQARRLLGYPEESVGRSMTPDYVAVRPHWTIGHALDHARHMGIERETVNWLYVTDDRWKLLDALTLRSFILADPENTVEEIMDHRFVAVSASADREEAVRTIQRHDLEAVPVVDSEGVLVGIVTVDDVLEQPRRKPRRTSTSTPPCSRWAELPRERGASPVRQARPLAAGAHRPSSSSRAVS